MKKFISKILVLAMVLSLSVPAFASSAEPSLQTYMVNVDGQTISLTEGEVVSIPLELTDEGKQLLNNSDAQPYSSFAGNAGVLTIWGVGTRFYWSVSMSIPATSFAGTVTATDLTSGLSCGMTPVFGFHNSCVIGHSSGHIYYASISGVAYELTTPVAKTVSNWTYWRS